MKKERTITHHFDVDDAEKYGLNCAVILYNMRFWLDKNVANKNNVNEGRVWTYNTREAFSELFPYLSVNQIRYALKKLEDEGVILTGNFNKIKFDKTIWYSVNEDKYIVESENNDSKEQNNQPEVTNSSLDVTKFPNGSENINNTIPDSKPDNKQSYKKPNNKPDKKQSFNRDFENLIELAEDDVKHLYNNNKIDNQLYQRVMKHKSNSMFSEIN